MNKLRAMFLLIGVTLVGATSYQLFLLKPEFDPADAVDAGLLAVSTPARLSCRIRVKEGACRQGNTIPAYQKRQFKARAIATPNQEAIVFDVPDAWRPCITVVGTITEACTVLEAATCTVPAVCNAGAAPQVEPDTCACRPAAGVCTKPDGSALPFGVTLQPGEFIGAGCVPKYCGPEIAGEQGQSWPSNCPG